MFAEEGMDEAVAAADTLEKAAIGAVAEEFAVVPGAVTKKVKATTKTKMLNSLR
jgi:hypothetical protein